jgi:predicted AAA+ superfamily ATPase
LCGSKLRKANFAAKIFINQERKMRRCWLARSQFFFQRPNAVESTVELIQSKELNLVVGPPSSGKTTQVAHTMKQLSDKGEIIPLSLDFQLFETRSIETVTGAFHRAFRQTANGTALNAKGAG